MKYTFFFLLICISAAAQKIVPSEITSVNLYPSGAQVFRKVKLDIKPGSNKFLVKQISPNIEVSSIRFELGSNELSVADLTHQNSYLTDQSIIAQNTAIISKNNKLYELKQTYDLDMLLLTRDENLLLANQTVGGSYSGMKAEDLERTSKFFHDQMKSILISKQKITHKLDSLDAKIKENIKEMNAQNAIESNKMAEIAFTIDAKKPLTNHEVVLSYFVQNAGWNPTYDIKAEDISKPISLLYKAEIYQYTGENWKEVELTLNNLSPKTNGNIPALKPWKWGTTNDYSEYYNNKIEKPANLRQISGFVFDEEKNRLPGVTVTLKDTPLGTATDVNGFYRLNIPPDLQGKSLEATYAFVGYQSRTYNINNIPENIQLEPDLMALQEVVVVGYGTPRKKDVTGAVTTLEGRAAGVQVFDQRKYKDIRKLVTEEEAPTSLQFKIDKKFSLESDGKLYTAELKETEVPAFFEYNIVPKIDPAAFLTAQILDWESLKLLPGTANLYLEGTFLGKTELNLSNKDTLNISLGRDPGILVSRNLKKSYARKTVIGGNVVEKFDYEIEIRNTKSQKVNIKVLDQFPISNHKEIEINAKYAENAKENVDTGELIWATIIEPRSKLNLPFGYTVKYPKTGVIFE